MAVHCNKRVKACFNCGEKPKLIDGDDPEFPCYVVHETPTCPYKHEIHDETFKSAIKTWDKTNKWSYWIRKSVRDLFR